MSQCSVLYSTNSNQPYDTSATSEIFEACNARVPLLWLSMYTGNDIMVKDYNYEEEVDGYLLFCTSKELAVTNLMSRESSLKKLIPAKYHVHIEKFKKMIKSSLNHYIVVSIGDVESMNEEPLSKSAEYLKGILSGLDDEITAVRTGIKKLFLGSGIPLSWRDLISRSAGNYTTLSSLESSDQWLLSGFVDADEMDRWKL